MDKSAARNELKKLHVDPEQSAEFVLRHNQEGDAEMEAWIDRVNQLLKIAQSS